MAEYSRSIFENRPEFKSTQVILGLYSLTLIPSPKHIMPGFRVVQRTNESIAAPGIVSGTQWALPGGAGALPASEAP